MKNWMKMIWTALVGEIGQGKCPNRTHQLDNPSDEGFWHMAPRGCLMPILKGEHDSHIHVAGITCMSLVKVVNQVQQYSHLSPPPDKALAQVWRGAADSDSPPNPPKNAK